MFCPYHGEDHPEDTVFSDEHILPKAVGGSDELVIRICKAANDKCGSSIDFPFLDNFPIAHERFIRGLKGQSGAPPQLLFRGPIEIEGRECPSIYRAAPTEKKLSMKPLVERTIQEDGTQSITINCDETQVDKIVADINAKLSREGYHTIDIDAFKAQAKRHHIQHPKMNITTSFDTTSFQRVFVKMALGISHFVMGERYTRGFDADLLRQFLWEDNSMKREEIPLNRAIWPACESGFGQILAFRDWHLLAILNNNPLIFIGILFGKYDGTVKLSETIDTNTMQPGDGTVFLINPTDRRVRRFRYYEYIARRQRDTIS